jgi:hypothetical protein
MAAIGLRLLLLLMLLLLRRDGSAAAAGVAAMRLQDSDSPLQLLRCATNVLAPAGRNIVRATRSMAMDEGDALRESVAAIGWSACVIDGRRT